MAFSPAKNPGVVLRYDASVNEPRPLPPIPSDPPGYEAFSATQQEPAQIGEEPSQIVHTELKGQYLRSFDLEVLKTLNPQQNGRTLVKYMSAAFFREMVVDQYVGGTMVNLLDPQLVTPIDEENYVPDSIMLGDVGVIANDGKFHPLFNILRDRPENNHGRSYPPLFHKYPQRSNFIAGCHRGQFRRGAIFNDGKLTSVQEGAGLFSITVDPDVKKHSSASIAILPEGFSLQHIGFNNRRSSHFWNYLEQQVPHWLSHHATADSDISNRPLAMVTATYTAPQYGILTLSLTTPAKLKSSFPMTFEYSQDSWRGTKYHWKENGNRTVLTTIPGEVVCKTGPDEGDDSGHFCVSVGLQFIEDPNNPSIKQSTASTPGFLGSILTLASKKSSSSGRK